MTIYAAYGATAPDFLATDQDPAATRFLVSGIYVDADVLPSPAEVAAFVAGVSDATGGNLLKVDAGGGLVTATPGIDYVAPGGVAGSGLNGGTY